MTRPKKGSTDRRIIVDLSFPPGVAVNDGIDPTNHFGVDVSYTLPTILDLINRLQNQGKGAYLWKADLTRAYRQLRVDPLDTLLGICTNGQFYLDLCPPFGCRSSAAICKKMANALIYIMSTEGRYMLACLNDFGSCDYQYQDALASFIRFKSIAMNLGLQLADHKCCPPTTSMDWLGYQVNTVKEMSVKIPPEKMNEVLAECDKWLKRRRANKKMVQAIAGKLIFVANCVQQARKFTARILATLRAMQDGAWITLN